MHVMAASRIWSIYQLCKQVNVANCRMPGDSKIT
jgi:hypothetical protein